MKKMAKVVLTLSLALLMLMLTACGNEQRLGAWIENHIQESSERLKNHIEESKELCENDDSSEIDDATEETQDDSD